MNDVSVHRAGSRLGADELTALQAIGEPNRARIIELLGHGEHCVCDVGWALEMSTALVSHHLRVLRACGVLRERRSGRWAYYSLDLERIAELRAAVVTLLSPGDEAASACLCSDCGTRASVPIPGDALRRVPVLGGTAL